MKAWKQALVAIVFVASSVSANAAMEGNFTIVSILQDATNYGGCMARLSGGTGSIQALGYSCPADPMVTFDCKGSLPDVAKSDGLRNFNAAQLAMVTGATVRLHIDDTKKINGWCYSRRVDVFAP